MILDEGKNVIVCNAHGSYAVHPCTMANAKALLAQNLCNLYETARQLAAQLRESPPTKYLVVDVAVTKALAEIVKGELGAETVALRRLVHGGAPSARSGKPDERPAVLVDAAMRDEVVLWAFKKGLDVKKLDEAGRQLSELKPHEDLSFMANLVARAAGREIQYVDSDELELAEELNLLQFGKWKEDARESRVVSRYLEFINNNLTHRDVRYEVAAFRDEAE